MLNIPLFFRQHALPADADERSVKRVYARQLKKIDQEVELASFQALREAYEHALDWIKHRDRTQSESPEYKNLSAGRYQETQVAQEEARPARNQENQQARAEAQLPQDANRGTDSVDQPAQGAGNSTNSTNSANSANSAKSVFESICWPEPARPTAPRPDQVTTIESFPDGEPQPASASGSVPEVGPTSTRSSENTKQQYTQASTGQSPTTIAERVFAEMLMAMRAHSEEAGFSEKNLQQTMDDPRLYNSEARYAFETLVAAYLVRGWRQGNGELFDAAFSYFSWAKDKRRLLSLGRPGHALERACKEMHAFNARPAALRKAQWELLLKLRIMRSPSQAYLHAHYKKIEVLSQLYPTWIWMVTSKDNFAAWKALVDVQAEEIKAAPDVAADPAPSSDDDNVHSTSWTTEDSGGFFESPRKFGRQLRRYILPLFLCASILVLLLWVIQEAKTPVAAQTASHQTVAPKTPAARFDAATRKLNTNGISPESARTAINELAQLADGGYALASYQLGWVYREGKNSTLDETEARKWFVKAAQQGNLQAAVMIGDYYFEGRGGSKDLAEALRWYALASGQGQSLGQVKLAHMYANGIAVKKDTKRALELIMAAADSGQSIAQSELGLIRLNGTYGSYISEERAAYWFLLSARQNDAIGQRMFGVVNEKGLGGYNTDREAAASWYAKAARQGDSEASKKLKSLCKSWTYPECQEI